MEWRPISVPQEEFLSLPDTIREAAFGGSAGPGKSECLMMYPIVRQWYQNPRFKALFMRRTYRELKNEIIPRSRELYTAFGAKFNKSDLVYEFESGALIFFGHCEHEGDVHNYDSMEINLFLPDEIQTLTEYIYMYIGFTRVRTSIPGLPAIIRGAVMPGDIGHTWVKNRFIKPAPEGSKIIIGKGGNKRIFIFSTLADNPKIDPSYSPALDALPEAERRAKKFGDWSSYEGQVFSEFRDKRIPDEPDNALHVVEPFQIPDWWPKILVIDWGYRALTYALYGAISPSKRVYAYREQAWRQTKIEEWSPYVRQYIDKEKPKLVKVCKSAGQDRGQEHTIQEQISTALDFPITLTNNNAGSRIAGKQMLHEYLRWRARPLIPVGDRLVFKQDVAEWTLRNYGPNAYNNYLKQFHDPEPEDNLPKLQIFSDLKLLPEAIKACIYAKGTNLVSSEDVATFDGDDPYDTLRYLVDTADGYFHEAEDEMLKLQTQQRISDAFEQSQDWNALYRQARILEAGQDQSLSFNRYSRHHAR